MSPVTKIILNLTGSLCVGLAVLGIFLPLLPTTPFLLLASACYVRGSERLHRWLMNNRVLGKYIRNIQQRRGIPLRAKIVTIALLWASIAFSVYSFDMIIVQSILILIAICTSTLILRMRTLKENE
ncbi:MAG TPA: YbaN family protein [Blastocatellia bacterium]